MIVLGPSARCACLFTVRSSPRSCCSVVNQTLTTQIHSADGRPSSPTSRLLQSDPRLVLVLYAVHLWPNYPGLPPSSRAKLFVPSVCRAASLSLSKHPPPRFRSLCSPAQLAPETQRRRVNINKYVIKFKAYGIIYLFLFFLKRHIFKV